MGTVHHYRSRLEWRGNTGAGYDEYPREHRVSVPPAQASLTLSSDPAFLGDAELANPEQLLVAAASSCQLLSFLARAARSQVTVLSYEDEAEGVMPEDEKPMRITKIILRPRIVVGKGTDAASVHRLVERAHDGCFIANSVNTEIAVEATVEIAPRAGGSA